MDAKDLRIVFMGTPEFAVPSLRALVGGGYNVVGVVTSPDKPAGRGQKIHRSEVKIAALELGLPVLQPEKLKAPEFVEALEALRPDLGIVIAFRMLPEVVWAMPRLGTFNLHASLLPQYRGAAPINWAIINGETETGVTTFLLNHEIDKGGIMMPGTCSAGEMQQAMNMGCEALKFFPAEANGGVGMLKNIGAALKGARWMCTGGVNAKNVNDYLGYDQIFAVGGTWMCKSDVIKAGDWAKITAQSKEAVDTMLGLHLIHVGINTGNEEEAAKVAGLISTMLNMKVTPGNSSIFVGNKEFEIMKKPGRGTNGHIAIGCNNVDRAIYHLSQRGVKFDLDSKNVKNGKTVACYMEGEIAGFAFHLVQA